MNAKEFQDLIFRFKGAVITVRNNPTLSRLFPDVSMLKHGIPEVRRKVVLKTRKRGCAGMNRPFTVTGRDNFPPLMCDSDAWFVFSLTAGI